MPKFKVTGKHVTEYTYIVEARNEAQAIRMAEMGCIRETTQEYGYDLHDYTAEEWGGTPVTFIGLTLLEGPTDMVDRPKVAYTYTEANELLNEWAMIAPDLGYYKTRVEIQWRGGEHHIARVDLHRQDAGSIDLARILRREFEYMAGRWKGPHATEEQYAICLQRYGPRVKERYTRLLDTHEV